MVVVLGPRRTPCQWNDVREGSRCQKNVHTSRHANTAEWDDGDGELSTDPPATPARAVPNAISKRPSAPALGAV